MTCGLIAVAAGGRVIHYSPKIRDTPPQSQLKDEQKESEQPVWFSSAFTGKISSKVQNVDGAFTKNATCSYMK